MIPFEVGTGRIGAESFAEELLQALIRLQGEGGYATGDDSARVRELLAHAIALSDGVAALDSVFWNLFAEHADELLAEHELAMLLPNDAARSTEERQARLRTLRGIVANASSEQLLSALTLLLGSTPTLARDTAADVSATGAEREAVFQGAIVMPAWSPKTRRAAELLLRRHLPAWMYGHLGHHRPDEMIVTSLAPAWAGSTTCGESAITDEHAVAWTPPRPPARVKSYGSCSRLTARDLNALQEALTCAPLSESNNEALAADLSQARVVFFAASCASGVSTQLVSGLDFRNRYVRMIVTYDTADIRPGQGADNWNAVSGAKFIEDFWSTRTGVNSRPITTNLSLYSSSTEIGVTNTTGSTQYVCGCLIVSPVITSGTRAQRVATLADGSTLSAVDAAWWTALRDAGHPRAANGSGADTWTGYPTTARGAVHRTFVLPTTSRPGSNSTTYVVDTSIDWRDRLVAASIAFVGLASADPVFPGVSGDTQYAYTSGSFLHYTGPGITTGLASLQNYELEIAGGLRIGVRSSDGALVVQHFAASSDAHALLAGNIIATDRLSERTVSSAIAPIAAPVNAAPIEAPHLNELQDGGIYAQATRAGFTSTDLSSMPLGPVKRGHTNTPVEWGYERRRYAGEARHLVRQPVAGRLRRYFAFTAPNGFSQVVDLADWRDRLVSMGVVRDTVDITPGGASEGQINVAFGAGGSARVQRTFYSGPGGASYRGSVLASTVYFEIDSSTGQLRLVNTSGSTYYVVGFIEASFPLGPRSA